MNKVKHGNCYHFDLPDDCLNEVETRAVIDAFVADPVLKQTPIGEVFVLDIAIGPDFAQELPWTEYVGSMRAFKRAEFKKEKFATTERAAIEFLRTHFADMLTLPAPSLRVI